MKKIKNLYRYLRILAIRLVASICARKLSIPHSILIVAPHPDDEVFGCAGLIRQALNEGKQVKVLILTGGEGAYSQDLISPTDLIEKRRSLTCTAAVHLGLSKDDILFWNWKDGDIKNTHNSEDLEQLIKTCNPDAIFSPHLLEGWSDHIETTKLIIKLFKDLEGTKPIQFFQYCVWVWYSMPYSKLPRMGWKNAFSLRMTKQEHESKLKAIDEYIKPLTSFGKPYSGDLPELFVKANQWKREVYFRTKN